MFYLGVVEGEDKELNAKINKLLHQAHKEGKIKNYSCRIVEPIGDIETYVQGFAYGLLISKSFK